MEYKNNIFYNPEPVVKHLDEFKKEIEEQSYEIILEEKYKGGSNKREPTKKSLKWILNQCRRSEDIRILHVMPRVGMEDHFQVVFVNNWYFAWCNLELKHESYFVKKYNLKPYY